MHSPLPFVYPWCNFQLATPRLYWLEHYPGQLGCPLGSSTSLSFYRYPKKWLVYNWKSQWLHAKCMPLICFAIFRWSLLTFIVLSVSPGNCFTDTYWQYWIAGQWDEQSLWWKILVQSNAAMDKFNLRQKICCNDMLLYSIIFRVFFFNDMYNEWCIPWYYIPLCMIYGNHYNYPSILLPYIISYIISYITIYSHILPYINIIYNHDVSLKILHQLVGFTGFGQACASSPPTPGMPSIRPFSAAFASWWRPLVQRSGDGDGRETFGDVWTGKAWKRSGIN